MNMIIIKSIFMGYILGRIARYYVASSSSRETSNQYNHAITFKFKYELIASLLLFSSNYSKPTDFQNCPYLFTILIGYILIVLLFIISCFDYELLLIPSELCFLGFLLGTFFSFSRDLLFSSNSTELIFLNHLGTSIFSVLFLLGFRNIFGLIYGKEVLGKGDVYLIGFMSSWLGLIGTIILVNISIIISSVFVLAAYIIGKIALADKFAFGPFLAFSGFLVWLVGNQFWIDLFLDATSIID